MDWRCGKYPPSSQLCCPQPHPIAQSTSQTAVGDASDIVSSPPSKDFVQCQDMWYNDDSIAIATESLAFRVHALVMAANCEVFRDMV